MTAKRNVMDQKLLKFLEEFGLKFPPNEPQDSRRRSAASEVFEQLEFPQKGGGMAVSGYGLDEEFKKFLEEFGLRFDDSGTQDSLPRSVSSEREVLEQLEFPQTGAAMTAKRNVMDQKLLKFLEEFGLKFPPNEPQDSRRRSAASEVFEQLEFPQKGGGMAVSGYGLDEEFKKFLEEFGLRFDDSGTQDSLPRPVSSEREVFEQLEFPQRPAPSEGCLNRLTVVVMAAGRWVARTIRVCRRSPSPQNEPVTEPASPPAGLTSKITESKRVILGTN